MISDFSLCHQRLPRLDDTVSSKDFRIICELAEGLFYFWRGHAAHYSPFVAFYRQDDDILLAALAGHAFARPTKLLYEAIITNSTLSIAFAPSWS